MTVTGSGTANPVTKSLSPAIRSHASAGAGAAILAVIAGGILLATGTLQPSAPHSPGAPDHPGAGTPSGPARAGTIPPASTGPTTPVRAPLVPGAAATGSAAAIPPVLS
jgi:hypothetical protein